MPVKIQVKTFNLAVKTIWATHAMVSNKKWIIYLDNFVFPCNGLTERRDFNDNVAKQEL